MLSLFSGAYIAIGIRIPTLWHNAHDALSLISCSKALTLKMTWDAGPQSQSSDRHLLFRKLLNEQMHAEGGVQCFSASQTDEQTA